MKINFIAHHKRVFATVRQTDYAVRPSYTWPIGESGGPPQPDRSRTANTAFIFSQNRLQLSVVGLPNSRGAPGRCSLARSRRWLVLEVVSHRWAILLNVCEQGACTAIPAPCDFVVRCRQSWSPAEGDNPSTSSWQRTWTHPNCHLFSPVAMRPGGTRLYRDRSLHTAQDHQLLPV
jgi:hypothetical protein